MSDIVLGIRLTADGKDLVGAVRVSADEIDKLGGATKRTSSEAQNLNNQQKGLAETLRSSSSMIGLYSAMWNKVTDALLGAVVGVKNYIKEAALLNARYETLGVAMTAVGRNVGYTAAQMEAATVAMQKTGISMLESRSSAMRLIQAHIDLSQASKLARIAQDAAVIGNINSSEAFGRLVYGIQSAQVEVLRTIGLNVNFQQSYQRMADQLHKNVNALTDNEKSLARLNIVVEKGGDIAGTYAASMSTAAKQMLSMQRYSEDLKVKLGAVFNETLTVAVMAFSGALKGAQGELDQMAADKELDAWADGVASSFAFLADAVASASAMFRLWGVNLGEFLAAQQQRMTHPIDYWFGGGKEAIAQAAEEDRQAILDSTHAMRDALDARRKSLAEKAAAETAAVTTQNENFTRILKFYAARREAGLMKEVDYIKTINTVLMRMYGDNHKYEDTPGAAGASAAASDPYPAMLKSLKEKLLLDSELTEVNKLQLSLDALSEKQLAKLTPAHKAELENLAARVDLNKRNQQVWDANAKAEDAMEKRRREGAEAEAAYQKVRDDAIVSAYKSLDQMEFETTLIGLSNEGRERAIALRTLETSAIDKQSTAYADLRKRMEAALDERAIANKSKAVAEDMKHDQVSTWQSIDRTAHDTFVSIFDSGKSVFDRLRDTLKNGLYDLLYQMTLKKWIISISGAVSGAGVATSAFGASGAAESAVSAPAGVGGWLNVGSTLNSAYRGVTGGFSSAYTGFAQSSAGNALGLSSYGGADMITGVGQNQITALGQTVGTGLSYVGAGLAGIAIGTAIAGDKVVAGIKGWQASTTGAVIGSVAAGPIGGVIGGAIGGAFNAAFGMGPKQGGTTTLQGAFGAGGFAGQYATPWKQEGGWFRSDRSGTDYASLAADQVGGFKTLVAGTAGVFEKLVTASGEATRSITGWTFAIDRQVATEEQQKQLVIDMADSMGSFLIPELAAFQAQGESLADTAVRLSDEFLLTDRVAALLGKDASAAFGAVGLASLAARDNLVSLMGGIQSMTTTMQFYYENFYSDAERQAIDLKALGDQFGVIGVALPTTREAFRALVEGLDLTTAAGRGTFAALMGVAPAFDAVMKAAEAAGGAVMTLADQIDAVRSAASTAVDDQISASRSAGQQARSAADAYRGLTTSLADAVRQLRGGDLSPLLPKQKLDEARAQLDAVYGKAATGDAAALAQLPQMATDFLSASRAYNASSSAYTTDFNRVMGMLAQAQTASTAMTNWSEYQATLLETQTAVLEQIRENINAPSPDTELLKQQVGLLGDLSAALQAQTTQIVAGDGAQALLMQDQTGKIVLANTLTVDQTGKVVLGNSLLGQQAALLASANSITDAQTGSLLAGSYAVRDYVGNLTDITVGAGGKLLGAVGAQTGSLLAGKYSVIDPQTGKLVGLTVDQTGAITASNTLLSAANAAQGLTQALLNGQTAQIVGGNLILRDQSGMITSSNKLLVDQTGKIDLGNTLTGTQTNTILTGNATQDVIRSLSKTGLSYSEEMLRSLVTGATTQSGSLQGISAASDLTVSLLRQLVNLGAQQQAADAAAAADAKAKADAAIRLASEQSKLTVLASSQSSLIASVKTGIDATAALAAKYGMQMQTSSGAAVKPLYVDASGILRNTSEYQQLYGNASNYAPFKNEFWSTGGVYDQTYGQAAALQAAANAVAAQKTVIQSLQAIPGHAGGGVASGWSIVGEQGPELVNFTAPGRVYTADQTSSALGGGLTKEDIDRLERAIAQTNAILQALAEAQGRGTKTIATAVEDSAQTIGRTVARAAEANTRA